ncbi:hypothetical protein CHUAL_001164 [Chamberlinius hualienensis]
MVICSCISSTKLESHVEPFPGHAPRPSYELLLSSSTNGGSTCHEIDGSTTQHKDAFTLTDLCNSGELHEVEIVSLVEEQLPSYRLRADTLTKFIGYENEDWYIPYPVLPPEVEPDFEVNPDLIKETLEYFGESNVCF